MDNQEPQVEPQPAPQAAPAPVPAPESVEVAEPTSESPAPVNPVKIMHQFFDLGDDASIDAYNERVREFCDKMDFQSLCNESAMVSGAQRNYIAHQAALDVLRGEDDLSSKTLHKLHLHYNSCLKTCVGMYVNAHDDIVKYKEIASGKPMMCMVVYADSEDVVSMYEVCEHLRGMKDTFLKMREEYVRDHGQRWTTYSIDVAVPGYKDMFVRVALRCEEHEHPFEVMQLYSTMYPMYTTEQQTKWLEEFEAAHKLAKDPDAIPPPVPDDDDPRVLEQHEWERGNRRRDDNYMYDGKYMFKSGVIKLRVVNELEAHTIGTLEKWREEYCKFLEGIANKFNLHVLDNICDEEFVVPPNVLRRDDIQRYLSIPTYKHLPGAKLVFLIHGDGGTIIMYNHEKMLTGACDVQSRGTLREGDVVV